jgi:ubiquinol-cytochrome c reductase cytochrome c subunit
MGPQMIAARSLLGAAMLVAAGAASAQGAGDAERGAMLYESTGCWQCHGYVGQGGGSGPPVAPPMAYEPFLLQLRQPRFVMIPYSEDVLTDQDASDIHAFLAGLPPPPDPASVPLLQSIP